MMGASVTLSCCSSGAYGAGKLKTTVLGSGLVTATLAAFIEAEVREWYLSSALLNVNTTSSEVRAWPSCHLTPSRRVKRYTAPFCSTVQLAASSGVGLPS